MSQLIYQRIISLRETKDLTQAELAELASIESSYISKLERGKAPNAAGIIVAKLARALETSTDYLLGLTDSPSPIPAANHPSMRDPLFLEFAEAWPDLDLKQRQAFVHLAKKGKILKAKRERGEE